MGKFLEMTSAEFRTMLLEGDSPYRKAPLVGNKSKYNNKKSFCCLFAQLDKKCLSLQTKYYIQDNGKHSKLDI